VAAEKWKSPGIPGLGVYGGVDETRTRDLRRDRAKTGLLGHLETPGDYELRAAPNGYEPIDRQCVEVNTSGLP